MILTCMCSEFLHPSKQLVLMYMFEMQRWTEWVLIISIFKKSIIDYCLQHFWQLQIFLHTRWSYIIDTFWFLIFYFWFFFSTPHYFDHGQDIPTCTNCQRIFRTCQRAWKAIVAIAEIERGIMKLHMRQEPILRLRKGWQWTAWCTPGSSWQKEGTHSTLKCILYVFSTTNIIFGRLFSRAKIVMSDLRNRMLPRYLKVVFYQQVNRHLWDKVTILMT